jgi:hypothetical protein
MDMGHWIEPQVLGDAQKGYGSPIVTVPTHAQYIHDRPPGMAPPGVHHYVNRPGQLQGMGLTGAMGTVQRLLPGVMIGVVGYVLLAPWISALFGKWQVDKKTKKNPRRRRRRRKRKR